MKKQFQEDSSSKVSLGGAIKKTIVFLAKVQEFVDFMFDEEHIQQAFLRFALPVLLRQMELFETAVLFCEVKGLIQQDWYQECLFIQARIADLRCEELLGKAILTNFAVNRVRRLISK